MCPAAGKGAKVAADLLPALEHMLQENMSFGARADSGAQSDEWRDSVQPLGAPQPPHFLWLCCQTKARSFQNCTYSARFIFPVLPIR